MSDAQFLDEIIANPHDDVPRLVYADWLEERGDPRGEFIRLQFELTDETLDPEHRRDLQIREADLLDEHQTEWTGPVADLVTRSAFARGFIEFVVMPVKDFVERAEELYRLAPIRSVMLNCHMISYARGSDPEVLVNCPHLKRLAGLALTGMMRDDDIVRQLFRRCDFPHLERLILAQSGLSDDTVRIIAEAPSLTNLKVLDLSSNQLRNAAVMALAESTSLTSLETLLLAHNRIRLTGARAIASSDNFPNLKHVDFRGNPHDQKVTDLLRERFGYWNCEV